MQSIEKRYQAENELLEAVAKGDTNRALYNYSNFFSYRVPPRNTDRLRNAKNLYFSLNTLLRKAVQNGFVHPLSYCMRCPAVFPGNRKKVLPPKRSATWDGKWFTNTPIWFATTPCGGIPLPCRRSSTILTSITRKILP